MIASPVNQQTKTDETALAAFDIAVILPAYNESDHIEAVLASMPGFVRSMIVVDDASTDDTPELVAGIAAFDSRVMLVRHDRNQGVGGALLSGYRKALELEADLVVKMDADGQMSPALLPLLLQPLIRGDADYTKGNRFHDFRALAKMPKLRRAGNMVLSFLTKCAVGYWNCFDPCNGYVAIRADALARLPFHRIARSWFFETSMLAELFLLGAVVRDVPMPACYANERSKLSIAGVLLEFPLRLVTCFSRRIFLKNFIHDFSMESVYLLSGIPMVLAGVLYGGLSWIQYAQAGVSAPTGTVVIPAMLITLGFQLLLAAVVEDVRSVPTEPLCRHAIRPSLRPCRRENQDESLSEESLTTDYR